MRQLIVGNDVAVAYTNGVLAAGAVDIQKEAPTGATSLLAADTYATVKKIRFVQGTAEGKNIVSPWIDGKNLVAVKSEVAAVQTAKIVDIVFPAVAVAFTAAGEVTIKLTNVGQGQAQFERKSYVFSVGPGTAILDSDDLRTEFLASATPDFIATFALNGTDARVSGTTFSLTLGTELANFEIGLEGLDGSNGVTLSLNDIQIPSLGYGDSEVLGQYEKSLQGDRSFYNRVELPNTPPSYVVSGSSYDLYSFVADNGALGQIKGVDNVRNITIGLDNAGAAVIAAFEAQVGPWLLTTPGAFII